VHDGYSDLILENRMPARPFTEETIAKASHQVIERLGVARGEEWLNIELILDVTDSAERSIKNFKTESLKALQKSLNRPELVVAILLKEASNLSGLKGTKGCSWCSCKY
jgi:hypothetical protein